LLAAIEDAPGRQIAHPIRESMPPLWSFAPHLVELEHAVRLGPARIQRHASPGDDRPGAVVHPAVCPIIVTASSIVVAPAAIIVASTVTPVIVAPATIAVSVVTASPRSFLLVEA